MIKKNNKMLIAVKILKKSQITIKQGQPQIRKVGSSYKKVSNKFRRKYKLNLMTYTKVLVQT